MEHSKTKVLYIAGMTRSGSTILGNILGELDECFTVGEPVFTWGGVHGRMCGCGEIFTECQVWNSILNDAFGDAKDQALATLQKTKKSTRVFGNLYLLDWLLGSKNRLPDEYVSTLAKLYRSIQRVTGAKVIIDESKLAGYALALSSIPGLEIWVLHLVRDPRAVAFSWQRKKTRPGQEGLSLPRYSNLRIARKWMVENLAVRYFYGRTQRYFCLRYEDLFLSPEKYVDEILAWMEIKKAPDPFITSRTVLIKKDHHLMLSNPVGIQKGEIELKIDNEWVLKMPARDKLVVAVSTWPLMLAYHYPLSGVST